MLKKLASLFLIPLTSHAALECVQSKMRRQISPGKYQEEKLAFCHDNGAHFYSKSCAQKLSSCFPTLQESVQLPLAYGSPGFKACRRFQGNPHFVELWYRDSWFHTALCFLPKGQFVDNDTVLSQLKVVEKSSTPTPASKK